MMPKRPTSSFRVPRERTLSWKGTAYNFSRAVNDTAIDGFSR